MLIRQFQGKNRHMKYRYIHSEYLKIAIHMHIITDTTQVGVSISRCATSVVCVMAGNYPENHYGQGHTFTMHAR